MTATPDAMRMEAAYSGPGGAFAFNVLHFVNIGGDFDAVTVDYIADSWVTVMKTAVASDWQVSGVNRFLDLRTAIPDETFSDADSEFGDNTSDSLPPNVAICLSLSAGASRRRRGRFYYPGIPSEFISGGGQIDSVYAVGIVAAISDWVGDVASTQGWVLAVYSRMDNVVRAITTMAMRDLVDTQRRRIERIGE